MEDHQQGIAAAIFEELKNLGHRPEYFRLGAEVPEGVDVFILFGPFGKFLYIPEHFAGRSPDDRPVFVYWNTEGLPDPRLPRAPMDAPPPCDTRTIAAAQTMGETRPSRASIDQSPASARTTTSSDSLLEK